MELSINAIVTIVIAMTMLAFGLGMINGVLSFGGSTLAQAVDGYRLDIPATSGDPLVIANPLSLESSGSNIILASFYNRDNSRCDEPSLFVGAWLYLDCPEVPLKRIQTVTLDIPPGKIETLGISVELERGTKPGTYPCFVRVYCENRNDRASNEGLIDGDTTRATVLSEPIFVKVN